MDTNIVVLAGRLGADPELRYTPGGTAVCSFRIANNRRSKDNKERTCWIAVNAWGAQAEIVADRCHRGDEVVVEGSLSENVWDGKDGQTNRRHEIQAFRVQFVSGGRDPGGTDPVPAEPAPPVRRGSGTGRGSRPDPVGSTRGALPVDDEIPF